LSSIESELGKINWAGPLKRVFLSPEYGEILKGTTAGLTAVSMPVLTAREVESMKGETSTSLKPHKPPIPGGIKAPHVHYNGETYMLNDEQWIAFSQKIIKGFQEKLAHAKGINFDQLMQLSDVMSEIISVEK
jgi:hypothetical protein